MLYIKELKHGENSLLWSLELKLVCYYLIMFLLFLLLIVSYIFLGPQKRGVQLEDREFSGMRLESSGICFMHGYNILSLGNWPGWLKSLFQVPETWLYQVHETWLAVVQEVVVPISSSKRWQNWIADLMKRCIDRWAADPKERGRRVAWESSPVQLLSN